MRNLGFVRYALSICVSATLLAGCGGSFNAPSSAAAAVSGAVRVIPAKGGAFSGAYSGTLTSKSSCSQSSKGVLTFGGTGKSSFFGKSHERGRVVSYSSLLCLAQGHFTLKSSKNTNDSVHFYVEEQASRSFSYAVTGGTGRFANAKGNGKWSYTTGSGYTYSDTWTGTLTF